MLARIGFVCLLLISICTLAAAQALAAPDFWRGAGCRDYPHLCQGVRTYKCQGATLKGTVQITGRGQIDGYIAFTSKAVLKLASGRTLKLERKKGKQTGTAVIVGSYSAGPGPIRIGPSRPKPITWDGTPTVYYGKTDYGTHTERNLSAIYFHLGKNYVLEVLNGGQVVNGYLGSMDYRRETFSCIQY